MPITNLLNHNAKSYIFLGLKSGNFLLTNPCPLSLPRTRPTGRSPAHFIAFQNLTHFRANPTRFPAMPKKPRPRRVRVVWSHILHCPATNETQRIKQSFLLLFAQATQSTVRSNPCSPKYLIRHPVSYAGK